MSQPATPEPIAVDDAAVIFDFQKAPDPLFTIYPYNEKEKRALAPFEKEPEP
jgi:hypothetical protein